MQLKNFPSLIFLLLAFPLFSQQKEASPDNLIPRELLFLEKDKVRITLSKDGETIFYQKQANGADSSLFSIAPNAPLAVRRKRFNGALVNWTAGYQKSLVAVIRQDTNLVLVSTSTTAQTDRKLEVPPFKSIEFLALSARFPNKVVVNMEAKDATKSGIYIVDLLSSSQKRLGIMGDLQQVFFDENFGFVAAMRPNEEESADLLRRENGQWVEVRKYPFSPDMFIGGLSKIISVSNDGKTIYATDNFDKDKTTLVAIETATGKVTELANDADADLLPYAASFDPSGKPTSIVSIRAANRRQVLDPALQGDFELLKKELVGGDVSFAGASADDRFWLLRKFDGGPVSYFHYDRTTKKLSPLFNDYSHLEGYELATRKALEVTVRDSMRLPVHIYVPAGMSKTDGMPKVPLPTIIYIHGGPWAGVTHWNSWFHNRSFQLLANRGYVVINMEFRGTTGLGKKFTDAGDLQWGEAMHHDIVDVANWSIKSGISNRKKIALWGWSYGGYAVNYAVGKAPDLFAAGISMYGISNLPGFCKIPFADNPVWRSRVGNIHTEAGEALLKKHSPLTYLPQIKAPMLLTHGTLDDRVPQEQSDDFAKALGGAGKTAIYFYYPEEGHDYMQPGSWLSFWAIAEHFLHKNVGGRKEGRKSDVEKGNFKMVLGEEWLNEMQ